MRVGTAVVQGMKKTGGKRLLPARLFYFGDAVTAVSPVCAGGGRVLLCTCFYAGGGRALPFGIPFTACGRGRRDAQPSFAEAIRYL